jgi:hypothetical protein
VNRRVQGRVKQARKRLQKRVDIRAGRRVSMQQLMHQHHHEEEAVATLKPEVLANIRGETHELVNKETGQVLQIGTESQMRKQRAISMEASPEGQFSVRKIKVSA